MRTVSIAEDFTRYPSGRYRKNGSGSGEEFRDSFLIPALDKREQLTIDLNGVSGYSSSFLEEAFGGLIRKGYSPDVVRQLFAFKASGAYKMYEALIWQYINNSRNLTKSH